MTRQEIPVFKTREENVAYMNETLPIQESFDLIQRDLLIGGRVSSFYFVNGFTSEETMLKIMDALLKVKEEEMPEDVWEFANACIPYVEVEVLFDFDQILKSLLSGETCVFIDGYRACIVIDCRTYPVRSVEEPDKDKSLRGSRDGFVETLVYNTAMMRRRIRHPALIMEMMEVGDSSRTDVALCYMGDRVDKELLKNVRDKIRSVDTDDLRMNQQSLAECLFRRKWYNPFPKFKFTERPDTASACLLEGKVVILVDNSPSAMILPTSIFDMIEEANDYYFQIDTDQCLSENIQNTDQSDDDISDAGLPAFYAESELAAESICLCGGEGYSEYTVDLSAFDAGSSDRRSEACGTEYAKYVKHSAQCDRRSGYGRIFGSIGVV